MQEWWKVIPALLAEGPSVQGTLAEDGLAKEANHDHGDMRQVACEVDMERSCFKLPLLLILLVLEPVFQSSLDLHVPFVGPVEEVVHQLLYFAYPQAFVPPAPAPPNITHITE